MQTAKFAFDFREASKLSQRGGAARARMALDEARQRFRIDFGRCECERALAAELRFGELAVECPRALRGGFKVLRDPLRFAGCETRARGPEVNAGAGPAAVMLPLRGRFELANSLCVIVLAIGDKSKLPLRLTAARTANLRVGRIARAFEIAFADHEHDALDRDAR